MQKITARGVEIKPWGKWPPFSQYAVTASRLWREGFSEPPRGFALPYFARVICQRYALTMDDLKGPCRERRICWPRQEFMALAYDSGRLSMPQIGRFLGGRDHTTVLWGIRAHRQRSGSVDQRQRIHGALALPAPEIGSGSTRSACAQTTTTTA